MVMMVAVMVDELMVAVLAMAVVVVVMTTAVTMVGVATNKHIDQQLGNVDTSTKK